MLASPCLHRYAPISTFRSHLCRNDGSSLCKVDESHNSTRSPSQTPCSSIVAQSDLAQWLRCQSKRFRHQSQTKHNFETGVLDGSDISHTQASLRIAFTRSADCIHSLCGTLRKCAYGDDLFQHAPYARRLIASSSVGRRTYRLSHVLGKISPQPVPNCLLSLRKGLHLLIQDEDIARRAHLQILRRDQKEIESPQTRCTRLLRAGRDCVLKTNACQTCQSQSWPHLLRIGLIDELCA
eukprot:6202592-Pleurochrysis_carterae.AAC.3